MKKVNKQGPALINTLPQPSHHERPDLDALLAAGGQVFDLRERGPFAWGHLSGTVNIPAGETNYTTYVGWLVDYESPLAMILPDLDALPATLADLRAIGVDNVAGYFGPEVAAQGAQPLPVITAEELSERMATNNILVLDVRGRSEHNEEHIQGSLNIPLGFLPRRLAEVPSDKQVVTQCVSGYRSQIAGSLLQAAGFTNVRVLTSHMDVWSKLLPTESAA